MFLSFQTSSSRRFTVEGSFTRAIKTFVSKFRWQAPWVSEAVSAWLVMASGSKVAESWGQVLKLRKEFETGWGDAETESRLKHCAKTHPHCCLVGLPDARVTMGAVAKGRSSSRAVFSEATSATCWRGAACGRLAALSVEFE